MGSPEAKGQPAMPKGSSACRGWGFSSTRDFPFTQTFSHSRPVSLLTWPCCPATSTEEHTASHSDITSSPFSPVISHTGTAFHICEGTLTQNFQPLGSGHSLVFLLCPTPPSLPPLRWEQLGRDPAFRQSSGS